MDTPVLQYLGDVRSGRSWYGEFRDVLSETGEELQRVQDFLVLAAG
ncbi:hypothetical protein ACFLU6_01850 [Acidobacteriota bacterium]